MPEDVWSEQDTTPGAIEEALRRLLYERHSADAAYVPARVLNLVVVVDRDWRGEIANRLERVGRYHGSRTILCSVEPGRDRIDAHVSMAYEGDPTPGTLAVVREHVELRIGAKHLAGLDTIVDPILVTGLITMVWAPHGHPEAVDSLLKLSDVVLLDSVEDPDVGSALSRVEELAERAYVVDLAWLRSTPWRERVCATFDPPQWRPDLWRISEVTVRHRPDSLASAALFCGWLASRLGWAPQPLTTLGDRHEGRLRARRGEVAVHLEPMERQDVPGLAGITIETADGMSLSLDRGPGGLSARRVDHKGRESRWTLLGASRGETGILGEGVRQALLRDPTYRPALDAARAMVG
jgi:glucose-6-phosphate dehydrogenase assembly protein OpcA